MRPKKALIITLIILGLAAYVAGSFWVVGMIKQNTAATTAAILPQTTQRPTPSPTPRSTPTPTPTPTPLLGPGIYACDPIGICNNYSDDMRKPCPKTFADPHCLGMCGTPSVRCPQ